MLLLSGSLLETWVHTAGESSRSRLSGAMFLAYWTVWSLGACDQYRRSSSYFLSLHLSTYQFTKSRLRPIH